MSPKDDPTRRAVPPRAPGVRPLMTTERDPVTPPMPADLIGESVRVTRASRPRYRVAVTATLLIIDLVALSMALAGTHGAGRLVTGLAFVFLVPGWSIVGFLELSDKALEVGLTLALSLAFYIVAAQVLLSLHEWHLVAFQEAVGLMAIPPLMWQLLSAPRETGA